LSGCSAAPPSIKDYCNTQADAGRSCVEHWSDAPTSWDQLCTANPQYSDVAVKTCQGADIVILASVDINRIFFYDSVSGELIGIQSKTPAQVTINAGVIPTIDLSTCTQVSEMACVRTN
jgi:hypothetical protein